MKNLIKKSILVLICIFTIFTFMGLVSVEENNFENSYFINAQAASIKFKKSKANVYIGEKYTLTLLGTSGKAIAANKITWKSADKSIATVDKKGVVKGKKAGTVKITATYKSKKYTANITVKSTVSSNKSKLTFNVGETSKKYVAITYMGSNNIRCEYVSGSDIIDCYWANKWSGDTIKLYVTPLKGKFGKARLKIYDLNSANSVVYIDDTVNDVIDKSSLTLEMDESATLKTTTKSSTTVKWTTSDSKVAKVSNGKVSAVAPGTATITAKIKVNGKYYTGSCTVTVNAKTPTTPLVYEDSRIKVSYNKMSKSSTEGSAVLYFDVQNKTNRTILIQADAVSLDGYCFNTVIVSDSVSGNATGTVDITIRNFDFENVNINYIKYVGAQLRVISDDDSFKTYKALFVNKSLYGENDLSYAPEVSEGSKLYSDGNIDVHFGYSKESSTSTSSNKRLVVFLVVKNKTDKSILIQNDDVVISGKSYSSTVMSDNVLPHTTGYVDITINNCSVKPGTFSSAGGTFRIIDDYGDCKTYKAYFGEFSDYNPWQKDESDDYYDDNYGNDEGDNSGDNTTDDDNLWSYSDVQTLEKRYKNAYSAGQSFFTQWKNASSVNNLVMKSSYLNMAKGYADIAAREMNMLVVLCQEKASVSYTDGNGVQSTLLDLVTSIYNDFDAIRIMEVTDANAKECASEMGDYYTSALSKMLALSRICSQMYTYF